MQDCCSAFKQKKKTTVTDALDYGGFIKCYRTLTLHFAMQFVPSVLIALISQLPLPLAITLPVESTVATFVLVDTHFSFLLLAVSGKTVAFSLYVAPLSMTSEV